MGLFWLFPESIRWLLVTGRVDRAVKTLKRIAKWNRRELSIKTINAIQVKYSKTINQKEMNASHSTAVEKQSLFQLLWKILTTRALALRFGNCCYQWAASSFTFYGLSQSSTQIPGADRYISFIIVMAIEIPSKLLTQPLLHHCKRKSILFVSFTMAAIAIFATSLIPTEHSWAVLLCFVVGKGAISFAFTSMYVYTTELWPTSIRLTIMNTSSMFGRFGSMIAPFVVIVVSTFVF